jgi:hypothetical protein
MHLNTAEFKDPETGDVTIQCAPNSLLGLLVACYIKRRRGVGGTGEGEEAEVNAAWVSNVRDKAPKGLGTFANDKTVRMPCV